jgi:hypothetical protein
MAFSKWKLAVLQGNYLPKVGFFLVFPYKIGIGGRRSTTVHTIDVLATGATNRDI